MAFKLVDLKCNSLDCDKGTVEMLIVNGEVIDCDRCGKEMEQLVSAPKDIRVSTYKVFRAGGRKGKLRNVFKKISDDD